MEWLSAPGYWPAQELLQRGFALIYLVAFVVAFNQFPALLGENGLLPVPRYLEFVSFRKAPSLFHRHYSDSALRVVAITGIVASVALLSGLALRGPVWVAMLCWLLLWVLYQSIVNVGQTFYAFGWESLLLECGFLAIFLGNAETAPSWPVIFLFRWVLFRLEFGAGLIKMRGDGCWRDLTCLYYHHETQPMPNPLSWFFHHLPKPLHRIEVAANHFAQLVVPFGLFCPQPIATGAGAIIIVTQSWLVLSGNFSWLNAATIVLGFSALDASLLDSIGLHVPAALVPVPPWQGVVILVVSALVVILSYRPALNLLSRRQVMNTSFDPLHLVNTYGAFGSITRRRYEIAIEGTSESVLLPDTEWKEYAFKGKPTDPHRLPRQIAPYHLRLDWLMWFAALSPGYAGGWFSMLLVKLLEGDRAILKLLAHNPFPDQPPRYIRARLFDYRFTTPSERKETGAWWVRRYVREFVPPLTRKHVGARET